MAPEEVLLADALGRVAAVDVVARSHVPGFARSTVDGYAVRASDTFGAGPEQPAYLELAGEVTVGKPARVQLKAGAAAAVPTGGMVPPGADAVVMLEYTAQLDAADGGRLIEVVRAVAPGENLMAADEDLRAGQVVVNAGRRLFSPEIAVLAAAGVVTVSVSSRPRVAVLSTGDELVPPEAVPGPGQVRDVNSVALAAAVRRDGGRVVLRALLPDVEVRLREGVLHACEQADLVLLSGGSSVGPADLVPRVLDGLGPPGVLAHGLAIRPGRPTVVAACGSVPVIGLPGHPVSALVVYEVLVRPILRWLEGENYRARLAPVVPAKIAHQLAASGGIDEYVRVRLVEGEDGWWAEPVLGKSGAVGTLARADGLVRVPAERRGLERGDVVEVRLLRW